MVGHLPVMLEETLGALQVRPGGIYLDATAGWGGHAEAVASGLGDKGLLLALDRDPVAVEAVQKRLSNYAERVRVLRSEYGAMTERAREHGLGRGSLAGIYMDLGVGSHQLDEPRRGFSFLRDGPLDMRYETDRGPTAADLVNTLPEQELARLFWTLGEERGSRRAARAIVRRREDEPFARTGDLAEVVARALGGRKGKRRHPATKVFQALRLHVNAELDQLRAALPQAVDLLEPGGRLVVISFHSLEDREVKRFLRKQEDPCTCPPDLGLCVCGQKPLLKRKQKRAVMPSAEEVGSNPRARSARLRVAVRTEHSRGEATL